MVRSCVTAKSHWRTVAGRAFARDVLAIEHREVLRARGSLRTGSNSFRYHFGLKIPLSELTPLVLEARVRFICRMIG